MAFTDTYRGLLKHSGIYAVGTILNRAASLVLLPVYTHYLSPADYGCIAVIDILIALLAIMIRGGIGGAVTRHHFLAQDEHSRDAIWWTGLWFVAAFGLLLVGLAFFVRAPLSTLLLGAHQPDGSLLITLALATLWFNSAGTILESYVRVQKWSTSYVMLSFGRLILNAVLNVSFLAAGLGVAGVLLGNLIASVIFTSILLFLFVFDRGHSQFQWATLAPLVAYGAPLVGTNLLALLMHQADRFFIRSFSGLAEVGIYSLAYQFGFGINALLIGAFGSIWGVTQFEVAEDDTANLVYAEVFQYFTRILLLVMLGVSLFARPIVALLASPIYAPAADLVPIICLGYFLFSLNSFVSMPATLSRRTKALLPASLLAAVSNLLGNYVLVPQYGALGAAWVTVGTFAVLCAVNYSACVRLRRIPFAFGSALASLVLVSGLFCACRYWVGFESPWGDSAICLSVWACSALLLLRDPLVLLVRRLELRHARPTTNEM